MAYFIQQNWKEESALTPNNSHIKAAIKTIKKVNSNIDVCDEETLYDKIKFEFTLIKSYLQLAVSYSQFSEHKKALNCGRKCLFYFTSLTNNIKNIFATEGRLFNFTFSDVSNPKNDKFKNDSLEHDFQNILEEILRINEFVEKVLNCFEQNNMDYINKLNLSDLDAIVPTVKDKKLDPDWLPNITIANFMHVEYVSLKKINHTISFEEIYTEAFLSLIVMLGATIYFMISTENRFMCIETQISQNTCSSFTIKPVFEKTNFQKIRKTKRFNFR